MKRAVVLAAGLGSRLGGTELTPKPLLPVAGVPLLTRVLRALAGAGVHELAVVTGFGAASVRALWAQFSQGLPPVQFFHNARYDAGNGLSLLAARRFVQPDTLLSMADHVYGPELVRRVLGAEVPSAATALGVDYRLERCPDLAEATKVQIAHGRVLRIGKQLAEYRAIDTGVFRIGPALIEELDYLERARGDCSLSEGVQRLADRGCVLAADVGDSAWFDVDTLESLRGAEARLGAPLLEANGPWP